MTRILFTAVLGFILGWSAEMRVGDWQDTIATAKLTIMGDAEAAPRHVARRTSRRTARRVTRRHSVWFYTLPHGCPIYGHYYYYCGGVYYQAVVENGKTVYIVVTP